MGYSVIQLKKEIVDPTLRYFGMYSPQAVNLLLGTMAQESKMGEYIKQLGNGPALGGYQMEPKTHDSLVNNYIVYRAEIDDKFKALGYDNYDAQRLKYDLQYATVFARIKYLPVPKKIPSDIDGMAEYWKDFYNTKSGKGKVEEFIDNYEKYVIK